MKFGIIFVLMMIVGQFVYAIPWSFSPPTTQEDIDRIAYATRPEVVTEVLAALDAEIARLERIPRGHSAYLFVPNIVLMYETLRRNAQMPEPIIVYITLEGGYTSCYL